MKTGAVAALILGLALGRAAGADLVGSPAPAWHLSDWIHSPPLELSGLKGKVVLVRWWTAPGCPYCSATAPALREFQKKYGDEGLQVVAVYHHKSREPLDPAEVKRYAEKYGLDLPVAIDRDWKTLKEWWLDRGEKNWTSVSFLLDRDGVVRLVHPGGQYVKGDGDYERIEAKIQELLKVPAEK